MVAATAAAIPMHWAVQIVVFAVYSLVATVIYWKKFRASNQKSSSPLLNRRVHQLIGKTYVLVQAIEDGRGKVQIADALWAVECDTDLPAGSKVKAVGSRRMTLLVEPVAVATPEKSEPVDPPKN